MVLYPGDWGGFISEVCTIYLLRVSAQQPFLQCGTGEEVESLGLVA